MAGGFHIATGYVEIEVDYKRDKLKSAARKIGREVGQELADGIDENVKKSSDKSSRGVGNRIGENLTRGMKDYLNKVKPKDLNPLPSKSKDLVLYRKQGENVGRTFMGGLVREMKVIQKDNVKRMSTDLGDQFQRGLDRRLKGMVRRMDAEAKQSAAATGRAWGRGFRGRFVADVDGAIDDIRTRVRSVRGVGTQYAQNFSTSFRNTLNPAVQQNFNRVMQNLQKNQRNAQLAGLFSARSFSRSWSKVTQSAAVNTGRSFATWFSRTHRSVNERQAAAAGTRYGQLFGRSLASALKPIIIQDLDAIKVFSVVTAMMGMMGGSVGQLSSMAGLLSSAGSAIFVAIGRVTQFVAELSKAVGLVAALPGVISSLTASFGVLAMATNNFRTALFGSGEDAEEALGIVEELSPRAANGIRSIRDQMSDLKKQSEETFLKTVAPGLELVGDKLIPKMGGGLISITEAWSDTINETLRFISSARGVQLITDILESTAQQIRNGSDLLPNFVEGFLILSAAAMPALEDLATWLNDITQSFRDWAEESAETGKVNAWIREGAEAVRTFSRLIGNLVGIMWRVFDVAGQDGLMGRLVDLTSGWKDFLDTAEGTEMLEGIFDAVNQQAEALGPVFREIGQGILDLAPSIGSLTTAMSPMMATIIRIFVDALTKITPGMVAVIEGLAQSWNDMESSGAISRIAQSIGDLIGSLSPWLQVVGKAFIILTNVFSLVADGVSNVVGPVIAFITQTESMRWILATIVAIFVTSFLPGALAMKVAILAVSATMAVFSDKLKPIRPLILGIAAVIAAVLIPGYLALGGQALVTAARVVSSWVAMRVAAIKNAVSTIRQMVLVGVAFWQMAASAVANGAIIAASWVRTQVAAATSALIQQIAAKGVARGLMAASKQALVAAGRIALAWMISLGPIGLVIAAVAAIVGVFVLLWNKSDAFRNFFIGVWDGIKAAAQGVADWFNSTLKPILMEAWDAISQAILPLKENFAEFVNFFKGEGSSLKDSLSESFGRISDAVKPFFDWLSGIWDEHGEKIIGFAKTVATWIGGFMVNYVMGFWQVLRGAIDIAVGIITGTIQIIVGVISGLLKVIMGIWKILKGIFTGDTQSMVDGLVLIFQGLWDAVAGIFKGAWSMISGLVKGLLRAIMGLLSVFGVDGPAIFEKMWTAIVGWFSKARDWIMGILRPIGEWIIGIWDWIYDVLVGNSIVPDMVNAIVDWFRNMGEWVLGILRGFRDWVIGIFQWIWDNVIMGIVRFAASLLARVTAFSNNVVAGWTILKDRAVAAWNLMVDMIKAVFFAWISWVVDSARNLVANVVNWFTNLRNRAQVVWNALIAYVTDKVRTWVSNIVKAVRDFVANIQKRFNEFRNRVQAIWNALIANIRDRVRSWIANLVKAIRDFITNIQNHFNRMRTNVQNTWNNLRNMVVNTFNNLRTRVLDAVKRFRQGVIDGFQRAKDGAKRHWDKLQDVAKAPVKFVVNTVYNDGLLKLWNAVAGKVPGLSKLDKVKLPGGFARGGVLPGSSTWRQGDDQMVPMRQGEGVAISEAMEVPSLRAQLLAWNNIGVRKGKGALRRYARAQEATQILGAAGFAKGSTVSNPTMREESERQRALKHGQYSSQKTLDRKIFAGDMLPPGSGLPEGFTRGGIFATIGNKIKQSWDTIEGGISGWAKGPIDGLKNMIGSKFSKGDNWEGIPYKAIVGVTDKMKSAFKKEDDSWDGDGGNTPGKAGKVIRKANSYVGKVSGRPNQFSRAMGMPYGPWCAAFLSEIFRMAKATGSIRGITARNGGAAVRTFNGKLRKVPHANRKAGDLPTYRGSGHINLLTSKNTTVGGNESNAVRRQNGYVNTATAILRPTYSSGGGGGGSDFAMAKGGIMGQGSHDIGGLLPDRATAHNRSGEAEIVQTLDQIKAMANMIANGEEYHFHGDIVLNADNVKDFMDVVNMLKGMKQTTRANGGNVRYRIRD